MAVKTLVTKRANDQINYKNKNKVNADFAGKDLRRSNCYSCNFTEANFNHTSFRGAQFKACTFDGATFDSAEFVATNFKNSKFINAKFENTIFDTVNLEGVNFEGAEFKNCIFVSTDTSKAVNLDLSNQDVKVFDMMPVLAITFDMEKAAKAAMTNEFVKYARVLDTKEGRINPISMMILSEKFDEETLVTGLKLAKNRITEDFCTLSALVAILEGFKAEGILE